MEFRDLNIKKFLISALDDMGFKNPTPIQEAAYNVVLSGRDVVGIAQTGTGKTFAYLLPLLNQLKFSSQTEPRILIIVPTRELVLQIVTEIERLTTYMTLRVGGVYGGTNINTQKEVVLQGLDVLVATPGRLMDLAMGGALKLRNVQKLVIDECDELLNQGFRVQLTNVLDMLPEKRQNLLFSATLSSDVDSIIDIFFNQPERLEVAGSGTPLATIEQFKYKLPNFNTKANLMELLLEQNPVMSKVIVFVANKRKADLLFDRLAYRFLGKVGVIHSNKTQNHRLRMVEFFEEGAHRVLIATDIISRGLDVTDVSHVVNFDMPEDAETYMHRIGRTGRAENQGVAITFVQDEDIEIITEIEGLMGMEIPVVELPEDLVISDRLIADEVAFIMGKNYLPNHSLKHSMGAFHEKIDKNKKINLGGSYRRKLAEKYKKPITKKGGKK